MLSVVWLTLKQHRFEVLAVAVICVGAAAMAVIEALRLNALQVPVSCLSTWQGGSTLPSSSGPIDSNAARCNELAGPFFDIRGGLDMSLTQTLLLVVPLVSGVLIGAPLAAREFEQGTAPLSWVHSISRRRWLLGKMLAGAVLLVPLMALVGLAADILEAASTPTLDPYASFDGYLGRGVIDICWALAAFAGAVAIASISGRTLLTVIAALVICLVVRVSWDAGMTHVVLRPFAVRQSKLTMGGPFYNPQPDMYLYTVFYLNGQPFYGDVDEWWAEHMATVAPNAGPTPTPAPSPATGDTSQGGTGVDGPVPVRFVIPGVWYWNAVALESGLLLIGSMLFGGAAMAYVEHRRPY